MATPGFSLPIACAQWLPRCPRVLESMSSGTQSSTREGYRKLAGATPMTVYFFEFSDSVCPTIPRISGEMALPEAVAENRNLVFARLVFPGANVRPSSGRDAEQREKIRLHGES